MTERDRPTEDKIAMTPEMIEAGAAELCRYNPAFETEEERVVLIYHAMRKLER